MGDRIHGHVTIEKTKKSFKAQRLLAILTLIFGIGLIYTGYQGRAVADGPTPTAVNGFLTSFSAIVWIGIVRVLRWWNHD